MDQQPRVVDLTDVPVVSRERAAEEVRRLVQEARQSVALMEIAADLSSSKGSAKTNEELAAGISQEARHANERLRRALSYLSALAVAALVAVGLVVAGPSAGGARAAEAPQPDPAVSVVRVVLSGPTVAVTVRGVVTGAWGCLDAWGPTSYGLGYVGHGCGYGPVVAVTARLDARFVPLGRSVLRLTDEADPLGVAQAVALDARRPSRFGVGTWVDMGQGQLYVSAPIYAYTASRGGWTPQRYSPVQVQERVAGRWVVRATLTSTAQGVASGVVNLGGGVHVVRVARPAGVTVWSTTGTTRVVNLLTEPIDVI